MTRGGGYANLEGPRVSIYAEVENAAGSRLVRANFHLDDDAYVLVGHIDADGVLRIEFPETPLDNGFAHGRASYQTAKFFGGFADQYRARFATGLYRLNGTSPNDSYDGGLGYVFVIASWQPMHFEKFSTGDQWDSFEVNDPNYAKDPRPAVYELAALLAGTNPSSYTVRFASVYDTRSIYAGSSLFADSFGAELCSGPAFGFSFGFPSTPFGFSAFNPVYTYGYGQPFWWRGTRYLYSAAFDCYYRSGSYFPFGYRPYGYGWGVAQTPPPPQAGPGVGRLIGIGQIRKPPLTPQPEPMRVAPGGATDVGATNTKQMQLAPDNTSPQYRTRGLVAHQDPAGGEVLAPRSLPVDRRARDAGNGVQGLVIRGGNSGSTNNDGRSQVGRDEAIGRRAPSSGGADAPARNSPRVDNPRADNPRADAPRVAPQPRTETPRTESPRMTPAPTPRVESPRVAPTPPPARVESPRSEPARSEPAARSAPPASSSSSSSGKPPGGKN
jgi:hypothetical protein